MITLTTSASGKAIQTYETLPVRENKYATGTKIISCLAIETNILYRPFPNAWNTDVAIIQNPANMKLKLMILRALTPISIMLSDASNI